MGQRHCEGGRGPGEECGRREVETIERERER